MIERRDYIFRAVWSNQPSWFRSTATINGDTGRRPYCEPIQFDAALNIHRTQFGVGELLFPDMQAGKQQVIQPLNLRSGQGHAGMRAFIEAAQHYGTTIDCWVLKCDGVAGYFLTDEILFENEPLPITLDHLEHCIKQFFEKLEEGE